MPGRDLVQVVPHGYAATAPTVTPPATFKHDAWDVAFDSVMADITVTAIYTVAPTMPVAGDGNPGNAYLITTLAELRWVSESPDEWNKAFRIAADIDAAETASWNGGLGFSPIGNDAAKFAGIFDNAGAG